MTGRTRNFRLFFIAALSVLSLVFPAAAFAQCPLCRSALEHAGDATARTMNLAIVVLLIPPVSIFCTIFAVAYKKIQSDDDDDGEPGGEQDDDEPGGEQ